VQQAFAALPMAIAELVLDSVIPRLLRLRLQLQLQARLQRVQHLQQHQLRLNWSISGINVAELTGMVQLSASLHIYVLSTRFGILIVAESIWVRDSWQESVLRRILFINLTVMEEDTRAFNTLV
jgi:hypothetical protein